MRKQVLVTADRGETRVAILEAEGTPPAETGNNSKNRSANKGGNTNGNDSSWRVGELYIERRGSRSIVGNVYKGKVDNVLPGLEAAFVDIGLEKNGFLHADDVVIPGVEVARRGRTGGKGKRISELLKPGQEILVQAIKASRAPLALLPGLVLHTVDRSFRAEVEAVLRHGAALDAFTRS